MRYGDTVGRVVKIFITGQDPRSLRTVELDNWTGVAITGQPEFFKKALEAEVLSRSCVYLLIRSSADDLPGIYVGESDDFSQRYTNAKFPIEFDNFLIFTSKDDNLTRAHVKWLEEKLWSILKGNSGKVLVANTNKPTSSNLPRADIATMQTYLANMIYVLEALGYDLFSVQERTSASPIKQSDDSIVAVPPSSSMRFYSALAKRPADRAYLQYSDGAYTLLTGSKISEKATDSLPANVRKLRDQLIADGGLVERDGHLELTRSIPFSKPSPASALVKGRSSTGYVDWARESDGAQLGVVFGIEPSRAPAD